MIWLVFVPRTWEYRTRAGTKDKIVLLLLPQRRQPNRSNSRRVLDKLDVPKDTPSLSELVQHEPPIRFNSD